MEYQTCPNCRVVYLGEVSQSACPQCHQTAPQAVATQTAAPLAGLNADRPSHTKRKVKRRDNTLSAMLAVIGGLAIISLVGVIGYVLVQSNSATQNDEPPSSLPLKTANPVGEKRLSITRREFRNKAATFPQGDNYKTGQQWHLSGRHWAMAFGEPHKVRFQNVNQTMIWRCSDGPIAVICLARPEPLADRNSPKGEKLIIKSILEIKESEF